MRCDINVGTGGVLSGLCMRQRGPAPLTNKIYDLALPRS